MEQGTQVLDRGNPVPTSFEDYRYYFV